MKSIPFLLLSGFFILPNSVSLAQTPQPLPNKLSVRLMAAPGKSSSVFSFLPCRMRHSRLP